MAEGVPYFNLLTDRLIRIRRSGGKETVTLPQLYAALMADDVEAVTALRPHQKHALHAFLVQAGAMAILAAGKTEPPRSAEAWLDLLRGLTPGFERDEPWCLVVTDLAKPAFLQAPVPEGTLDPLLGATETADELDVLITSRNHDLKKARMRLSRSDDWTFALLSLQTLQGYSGRNPPRNEAYYGISRMNGGSASRPFVAIAPTGKIGAHIRRDIQRLIERRSEIIADHPIYPSADGMKLVWLEPWNGVAQIFPAKLDPFYIEICRRVRFTLCKGNISARFGSSKSERLNFPDGMNGVTGDPWTPVLRNGNKALTVGASGFHYRRVVDLLDKQKFTPSPLQVLCPADGGKSLELCLSVIVRGQGKTEGFHERRIAIPPRAVPFFMRNADESRLADLAGERLANASAMLDVVLKPALFSLFKGKDLEKKSDFEGVRKKADAFLGRFDREIDSDFFDHLFDELAEEKHSPAARGKRRDWLERLKARADNVLATAEAGSPLSHVRRYRSRAAAKSILDGAFQKAFATWLED